MKSIRYIRFFSSIRFINAVHSSDKKKVHLNTFINVNLLENTLIIKVFKKNEKII